MPTVLQASINRATHTHAHTHIQGRADTCSLFCRFIDFHNLFIEYLCWKLQQTALRKRLQLGHQGRALQHENTHLTKHTVSVQMRTQYTPGESRKVSRKHANAVTWAWVQKTRPSRRGELMVNQTLLKTSNRYVDRTLHVHRLSLKTVEMRNHHTRWKEKLQPNRNAALMRKHRLTSEGSGGPTAVSNNGRFAVAIFRRLLSAASDDNIHGWIMGKLATGNGHVTPRRHTKEQSFQAESLLGAILCHLWARMLRSDTHFVSLQVFYVLFPCGHFVSLCVSHCKSLFCLSICPRPLTCRVFVLLVF